MTYTSSTHAKTPPDCSGGVSIPQSGLVGPRRRRRRRRRRRVIHRRGRGCACGGAHPAADGGADSRARGATDRDRHNTADSGTSSSTGSSTCDRVCADILGERRNTCRQPGKESESTNGFHRLISCFRSRPLIFIRSRPAIRSLSTIPANTTATPFDPFTCRFHRRQPRRMRSQGADSSFVIISCKTDRDAAPALAR